MKNKFSCFLTQKGRWLTATLFLLFSLGIGNVWGAEITIEPTIGQNVKSFTYGLFTLSYSSTKGDAKISSGAIAANTKNDVITINFKTTKSGFNIKSVEFQNLSNGALSSSDGTITSNKLTVSGSKNDINVVLTSNSNSKGSVKVKNVVVNVGDNNVETISFTSISDNNITFSSSVATTGLSSITSNGGSISSNILSLSNNKYVSFSSDRNITYIALLTNDDKVYVGSGFETNVITYADGAWNGSAKTVTFTNKTGGGRSFKKAYVIVTPAVSCTEAPAAPTGLTAAPTADGATFTITDGANTNNYEIVCKTASETPAADATPTQTGTSKTITVTGLSSGTYYAWVRSVCDATHKSSWYALGASTFTTLTAITPTLSYNPSILVLTDVPTSSPTLDKDGSAGAASYVSSIESVATVDGSGVVTAVAAGKTTITATVAANGDYAAGEATADVIVVPQPTHLIDNWLARSGGWASGIATTDRTNVTNLTPLSPSNNNVGTDGKGDGGKSSRTGVISSFSNNTGDNANNYMSLSFQIAAGKKMAVTAINIPVMPVTSSTNEFRATLSDNQGSTAIEGSLSNQTQGSTGTISFSSFGELKGIVTLKIWAYGWTDGYRIGTGDLYITGTIENDGVPTGYAITKSATNGTIAVTDGIDAITSADAGDEVSIAATPATGYGFTSWSVYKTGEAETTVTLADDDDADNKTRKFTMPAYPVTVSATFTAINYTLTWDKNAEDADALSGEYTSGTMAYGTTIVKPDTPTRSGYKFLGWAETSNGDVVDVPATMPAANKTYYAIWKEVTCPVSGVIYSLAMKTGLANQDIAHGQNLPLTSEYATITGGEATLRNNDGSGDDKAKIYNSEIYFNGANAYVKVDMDCGPLAVGDEIAITSTNFQNELYLTNTNNTSAKIETEGRSYTIVANDLLEGKSIFYIWRKSGGTAVGTITITRPAPDASVPTIDASTPADASYAAADPISAMTVTADAVAPKELHYQWYKEAGETDIEVGTDAASYTPTASGEYYCVVTNSPSGYTPKSATSRIATITLISSDATLAWIKAGDVNIALTTDVYDYEYTLPYNYAAATAPVITVGTTDANANADVTQATSKNGTATIHVLAQDNTTYKDYSVKFNEYSGCMEEFYFAKSTDAEANSVEQNEHGFFSNMTNHGTDLAQTFAFDAENYTTSRATSSAGSFGKLTIPAGFNANVYVGLRTTGERTVTLEPETGTKYDVVVPQSNNAVAEFTDVAAGVYTIKVSSNSNFAVVKAQICKFAMTGVTLPATGSVLVGQTVTLTPVFAPTNASNKNVSWVSDAPSVATVANGVVTGVAAGTANITVTTVDGGFQATCAVTVSEMDCDTYIGNLFSFAVVATEDITYTNVGEGENEKVIGAEVATVSNGAAYVGHTGSKADVAVAAKQSSVEYFKLADANTYLRIVLPSCALKAGDMISLTSLSQNFYISTTATYPSAAANRIEIPANGKHVVLDGDLLEGADEIYVWRKSGSTYLKTLSIDRNDPDHHRTGLNPSNIGTLCWKKNAALVGGTLYELAGKNEYNKLVFDEVENNRLVAGMPYIFVPENGNTEIKVYNIDDAAALTSPEDPQTGMMGTFVDLSSADGVTLWGNYVISKNHYIYVDSDNVTLKAFRAYITSLDDIAPAPAQQQNSNGAPRRRIIMGAQGEQVTTDINNVQSDDVQCTKVMIDGQLYILRGEKLFDATGRLVK